jgi:tetraacyldisaccharide 4'-kinase
LSALSGLYGRVTQLHRVWYERHPHRRRALARPVISIGNLVIGGSGKTPAAAAVARLLGEAGERPAILSRGYARRRSADGVVVVSDGRQVLEPTARSGDEPQMLARALPGVVVLVSPDRYLAGRLAERRFGCTCHVLDDGFQHLRLARDVDLVLVAPDDVNERVLPSGRLREPLGAARAADALLVTGSNEEVGEVAAALRCDVAFRVDRRYDIPRLIHPFGQPLTISGRRAIAVAAVARPGRFFAALRSQGWEVAREMAFRDHRWFTPQDMGAIRNAARDTNADVILTTEKDAMRLLGYSLVEAAWAYLPMELLIEPRERFAIWLDRRLALARDRRPTEAA